MDYVLHGIKTKFFPYYLDKTDERKGEIFGHECPCGWRHQIWMDWIGHDKALSFHYQFCEKAKCGTTL